MLLNAAALDCDEVAEELPRSCKSFYSCENAGLEEQELTLQLEDLGLSEVGYAHDLIQALLAGNFTYSDPSTPNKISSFCVFERNPLQNEHQACAIVLHLIPTQGQGKTVDEIKASAK